MFRTSAVVRITEENCVGCRRCVNVCPSDALAMNGRLAVLQEQKCVGCFKCVEACVPYDAISVVRDQRPRTLTTAITPAASSSVAELCARARLAPEAVICVCTQTTAAEVAAAVVDGAREPETVTLATGARAKCGMWCHAPVMRLLDAHGVTVERSSKDQRVHPDGGATDVAIWTIPDEVAQRYPEYRLTENLAAVEDGTALNSPSPWFPDVQAGPGSTR